MLRHDYATADLTVMLNDFTGANKVYIVCAYTDLRRSIDIYNYASYKGIH